MRWTRASIEDGRYVAPPQPSIFEEVWSVELLPDGRLVALGGYANDARVVRFHLGRELESDAEVVEVRDDEAPPPAPTLTLTLDPTTFRETAGTGAATGTLTRTGDLSAPLTVVGHTSDQTERGGGRRWPSGRAGGGHPGRAGVGRRPGGRDRRPDRGRQPDGHADRPDRLPDRVRPARAGRGLRVAVRVPSAIGGMAFAPDGKLLVARTFYSSFAGGDNFVLVRYTADGLIDTGFGPYGNGRVELDVYRGGRTGSRRSPSSRTARSSSAGPPGSTRPRRSSSSGTTRTAPWTRPSGPAAR